MAWELIWNARGPRGYMGVTGANGAQGLPGVNAVANDTATAGYMATTGTSATKTVLLDRIGVDNVQKGNAHPRLRKPLTAPIFEWSNSSAANMSTACLVDNSVGGGTGWSLYYSTDHGSPHATTGIFRANAATPFGPFVEQGRVYRDDTAGFQTEFPDIWWEARASLWYMVYQQSGVVDGQASFWATSADGNTWTRQGVFSQWEYGTPGIGHTGYFKRFVLGAGEYGYSLYGDKQALWYRDDSSATNKWYPDRRYICSQVDLLSHLGVGLVGEPSSDPNDSLIGTTADILWKSFSGGVFQWRGRPWWIGSIGPHGAGGVQTFNALCAAPLRSDLLGLAEKPVVLNPPSQPWENSARNSTGNIITYQNRTYMVYGTGNQAAYGLMEIY